ncbi:unnamed protein product [Mesocestoides corti]|uniref:Protein kinase domain-containing protein n=1 Tax=Mesocestoides corti TaxID=53468 RepID=A0A0R3UA61_MESCO|nr:unnamed protein product [Mesocestoides corti]
MQEPLNFSRTTAYSATRELASRVLDSLQAANAGLGGSPHDQVFDFRASSLPRDMVVTEQSNSHLGNPWAAFQSGALLAAAAAAMSTSNVSNCPRDAQLEGFLMKAPTRTQSRLDVVGEKPSAEQLPLLNAPAVSGLLGNPCPLQPPTFRHFVTLNNRAEQELQINSRATSTTSSSSCASQQNRKNSKLVDRSRRSRVVIHQFGDAEDHFSKALRNLHVKSTAEDEMAQSASLQNRTWTVTSAFDAGGGGGGGGGSDGRRGGASSPSEAQNIADLAVEKHFEKSLATFHAKQAAAAAAAAASRETPASPNKTPLDLSLTRTRTQFYPTSPSMTSSSGGSTLPSPRGESGGPSFNPKKKWLAQYGDDEGARIRGCGKGGGWSVDDNAWGGKLITAESESEARSRSCPLLFNDFKPIKEVLLQCNNKCETTQKTSKCHGVMHSSISSLQLPIRGGLGLSRAISLHEPSLGNSMELFDEDAVGGASKSLSACESPVSSPIAGSSGFFTDSNYSLDSSTLPVISEAGYFSSTTSTTSSLKARHLATLKEGGLLTQLDHSRSTGYEPGTPLEGICPTGRSWAMRKRVASDASNLASMKRSRSVVAASSCEHDLQGQSECVTRQSD